MNSESDNIVPGIPGIPKPAVHKPLVAKGETPLDFIKNNIEALKKEDVVPNAKVTDSLLEKITAEKVVPPSIETPVADTLITDPRKILEEQFESIAQEPKDNVEDLVDVEELNEVEPEPEVVLEEGSAPDNLRKLGTKLKFTEKELKALKNEKTEIEEKLKKYEAGEIVPEALVELQNRNAELEKYEKLHNLKASKEYREKYIEPLNSLQNKLEEIAADYEIPKEVMEEALNITSKAEQNRFLSNYLDPIGGEEVRKIFNEVREIQSEAKAAENTPAKVLAALQEESKRINEVREGQRKNKIVETSKNAWVDSIMEINKEGTSRGLILKEGNTEVNEKYVKPILAKAGSDFWKIVKHLADDGLTELKPELAKALATMVLKSHDSALNQSIAEAALQHANELEKNTKRVNGLIRPNIGGAGNMPVSNGAPRKELTAADAARMLTQQMVSGRK